MNISETVDIDIDEYIDEIKEYYNLVDNQENLLIDEIIEVLQRRGDSNFIREIQFKQKTDSKLKLIDLVKE